MSGSTGAAGKTGIPAPPLRAELARLDVHIDKIYKEIAISIGRMGRLLLPRLQEKPYEVLGPGMRGRQTVS